VNYYIIILLTFIILGFLIIMKNIHSENDKDMFYESKEIYVLGTIIQLKANGRKAKDAIEEAVKKLYQIDDMMSAFKKESDISKINSNAGIMATKINNETYEVIKKAVYYAQMSQGAFEPTIRPLVELYGFNSENPKIPSEQNVREILKLINYQDVLLDDKEKTVILRNRNQRLDLGAIAKGYAADVIRDIFIKKNIKSAIIDLGGNIYALGKKAQDKLWNIGIQDPLSSTGKFVGIISVEDKSIVTSGDYERYFLVGGKRYHHIINPLTGYPCDNEIVSATIISDNSIDGDGLTTCGFVLGLEEGMRLIEKIKGVDAIFITKDKKVYLTRGIKNKVNITNKDYILQ